MELDQSCWGNDLFSKLINVMTRMRWKVMLLVKDGIRSRIQVWDRKLLGYVQVKDVFVEEWRPLRLSETYKDAAQSVGLLWTSDQLVAKTSTWQHTTLTTDKYPWPRWDSNPRSQQVSGLRPLTYWDLGFDSHRGHGYLSVVSVVCCQVEVSATSWSLVQRSPTDCAASLCVI